MEILVWIHQACFPLEVPGCESELRRLASTRPVGWDCGRPCGDCRCSTGWGSCSIGGWMWAERVLTWLLWGLVGKVGGIGARAVYESGDGPRLSPLPGLVGIACRFGLEFGPAPAWPVGMARRSRLCIFFLDALYKSVFWLGNWDHTELLKGAVLV